MALTVCQGLGKNVGGAVPGRAGGAVKGVTKGTKMLFPIHDVH